MKLRMPILFFFFFGILSAQESVEKQLEVITNEEEATSYLENDKTVKGEIQVFNEMKHKTPLAEDLLKKGKGGTKTIDRGFETVRYKVLDVYFETHYRAAIIMFDSSQSSLDKINSTRTFILKKFKEGYPYDLLAKQYSMDTSTANRGGDLGWFTPGTYIEDLEHKIISREFALDDIFLVDIPDENKYYVVLKTHEPMEIKEAKVLKIIESVR